VITPSYNQGRYLESTLRSVLEQDYPDLEYIVVDGGSSDDSPRIIQHYAAHLSYWTSEPDRGQADAIRKGLARASGEWFVWINSDDLLAPGALLRVAAAAQAPADVIAGSTRYFDAGGLRGLRSSRNLSAAAFIDEQLGSGMKWHQPAVWLRRETAAPIGLNAASHYVFDHELLTRYLLRHPRVHYVPDVLAYFRYHDSSKTVAQAAGFRREQVALFRALAAEPEFAGHQERLDRAARAVEWLGRVDVLLDDRARPRLDRLGEIVRAVREDPSARCTANTRRAARRILQYGGRHR
jgi:glycosyltransferase involved in cell wall biosynthesis